LIYGDFEDPKNHRRCKVSLLPLLGIGGHFCGYITIEEADRRTAQRIDPFVTAQNTVRDCRTCLDTGCQSTDGLVGELILKLIQSQEIESVVVAGTQQLKDERTATHLRI